MFTAVCCISEGRSRRSRYDELCLPLLLDDGKDSSHQRDACNMQFYLVKFVNGERQLHLDPV